MNILDQMSEEISRDKYIEDEFIKPANQDYINIIKSGDFLNICYRYLDSKAFKENVISWIKKRWSNMTDTEIITDILQHITSQRFDPKMGIIDTTYGVKNEKNVDYNISALYYIIKSKNIEIIPINILKKLTPKLTEIFMDGNHNGGIWKPTSLKDIALRKRNTPPEYKAYLKTL